MEIGVGLPVAGPYASKQAIKQIAEAADKLDFGGVWTFERILRPIAELPSWDGTVKPMPDVYRNVYDSLDALSYVAALTERIKLGTSVVAALFQSPAQLGKRFATLDQLSDGRVIAGLGQGALEAEFLAAGVPMKRRGAGFDEYLEALAAVWGPDPVTFDGRFYNIVESNINPKPVQTHIPLIVGTGSPAALERAARLADGINPVLFAWERTEGMVKAFMGHVKAAGRNPSRMLVVTRINSAPGMHTGALTGSFEQIRDELPRAKEIGLTHIFWDMNQTDMDIPTQIKWMEKLRPLF